VRQHGLRGFDAVHLAADLLLRQTDQALEIAFSSSTTAVRGCSGGGIGGVDGVKGAGVPSHANRRGTSLCPSDRDAGNSGLSASS